MKVKNVILVFLCVISTFGCNSTGRKTLLADTLERKEINGIKHYKNGNHTMSHENSIREGVARVKLDALHAAAKGDRWRFITMAPSLLLGMLKGRSFMELINFN